ncbi:hypothetical protein [Plasmodium yoelii yoelii]|uniref:Uncharacterized protein n=1 Tax=Plasmodium yoelii yoelii TaxID=73239 RepID=Q7RBV3_PLAYO|nr:hypothetical protein [Plasmodium yoelii yoelii]
MMNMKIYIFHLILITLFCLQTWTSSVS